MLKQKHLQEWLESAVDEDLVKLNVQSLDGSMGQLSPKFLLLQNDPDAFLQNRGFSNAKKYRAYNQFDEFGGWIVWGEDEYFQFKPDQPRWGYKKGKNKGFSYFKKLIKYESPRKVTPTLFKLKVPDLIWDKIRGMVWAISDTDGDKDEFYSSFTPANNFWDWTKKNPKVPVFITEGTKKAGALLTAGYPGLALPGVTMGVRSKHNGIPVPRHLTPQLEELAVPGREFIIGFDQDSKPNTVANVNQAIISLGILLSQKGCKVSVVTWDSSKGKGVDDFIAAHGEDAFHDVVFDRQEFSEWQQTQVLDLSPYVSLQVNQRYLSEAIHPDPTAQIIGLKSAKNTGKTTWLARLITEAIWSGRRVLVLTHRTQLGQALCNIFGIDYVTEYRNSETAGVLGYGLCTDSLHPDSQANFNPADWENAYIVIDEIEQVLWHTLNSSTCEKERVSILQNLKAVLQTAIATGGKIFASDADLSPISLEHLQMLLGGNVPMWILENTYKPVTNRTAYVYNDNRPTGLFKNLNHAIASGEKVFISVASQKAKSLWSTQTLEAYFSRQYPDKKILRMDSETVGNPDHEACGCISQLNDLLPQFDIVIASNVIETGVSIECHHFDSVWGVDYGISPVDSFLQRLERERSDVPRHIWVAERGFNFVGNQSTNAYQLRQSTDKVTRANIALLRQSDDDELEVDTNFQASLKTWSKRGAIVNAGMLRYRKSIVSKLSSEGYQIVEMERLDRETSKVVSEVLKNTRKSNYAAFLQKVASAEDVTSEAEYQELRGKRSKSNQEMWKVKKAEIQRKYCVDEVTEELVEKEDNGYYRQLRLHYFLTVGREFLSSRDRAYLKSLSGDTGKAFPPDVSRRLLGAMLYAFKVLNVQQFFDEEATFTSDNLEAWLQSEVLPYQRDLQDLGINVTDSSYPVRVANGLLKRLGEPYKLKCVTRKGKNGVRIYQPVKIDDGREFIFEKWLERDTLRNSSTSSAHQESTTETNQDVQSHSVDPSSPNVENPSPTTTPDTADLENTGVTDVSDPQTLSPELLYKYIDHELLETQASEPISLEKDKERKEESDLENTQESKPGEMETEATTTAPIRGRELLLVWLWLEVRKKVLGGLRINIWSLTLKVLNYICKPA